MLGASGTWPYPGGSTSGYLVRQDGFNLWLDAGTGTLARLQEHIDIADVHGVLITHAHPDHFVDLYPFFYARFYGEMGPHDIPFHAPTGLFDLAAEVVSIDSQVAMNVTFAVNNLEPVDEFEIGPFRIRNRPMEHLGMAAVGYRIESEDGVLAYSGDTGPTHDLEVLAKDADMLLSEATWQDRDDLLPFHLSSRQAGEHATRAGAGRLVLTHIWPSLDKEVSRSQAAEAYDGPIDLAAEGMRTKVRG